MTQENEIYNYLNSLKNPRHHVAPTRIFKILRGASISPPCQKILLTKAKSLGGKLSNILQCAPDDIKGNNFVCIKYCVTVLSTQIQSISSIRNLDQATSHELSRLLSILKSTITLINRSSVDTSIWYCPLCWRHPAPGRNTKYCSLHMPERYFNEDTKKYEYELKEYRAAKRLVDNGLKYFEIDPPDNYLNQIELNNHSIYNLWRELKKKLDFDTKYSFSQASEMWSAILKLEKINLQQINESTKEGLFMSKEDLWGTGQQDWRIFAKYIVKYIRAYPLLKCFKISSPHDNEEHQEWLDRLSKDMSNRPEFDPFIEPGEFLGLIHRYMQYQILKNACTPSNSTHPKPEQVNKCISLRNQDCTYTEIAKTLGISRQRAYTIYKVNSVRT